jgi:hypothetical protein
VKNPRAKYVAGNWNPEFGFSKTGLKAFFSHTGFDQPILFFKTYEKKNLLPYNGLADEGFGDNNDGWLRLVGL